MGWTGLSVASDDRMPESKSDFYQTPHIASLAKAGMRFSNAYAAMTHDLDTSVGMGSSCHENVIGYDLFPTFCQWAGEQSALPSGIEGTSLVPVLAGGRAPKTFVRTCEELIFHFPHYGRGPRQTPQSAIRVGNLKLVRCYETGEEQLFDLAKDIGEQDNLGLKMPDKKRDLSARLDTYLARVKAQLPTVNPNYDPTEDASLRQGPGLDRSRFGSRSRR